MVSYGFEPVPFSVNFSRTDFTGHDLLQDINDILEEYHVPIDPMCGVINNNAFPYYGRTVTMIRNARKTSIITGVALYLSILILVPLMAYGINGVDSFKDGFMQMTIVLLISGLFDRLFIDWYWVGRTKA